MRNKSIVLEAKQINLAVELVELGARLQVLEAETNLSRERLLKLYKEVRGESPPKGMLPFSTDWFISWQPNIHSSLFIDIYHYMGRHAGVSGITAIIKAYRLYLEHIEVNGLERVLSLTRAWSLVRFFDARMLTTIACTQCSGHFISHTMDLHDQYVCGMCHMPSRAGKTRKAAAARMLTEVQPLPLRAVAAPKLRGIARAAAAAARPDRQPRARPSARPAMVQN